METEITIRRTVTRCRGSWKWQDAFGVVQYIATRSRNGRLIWKRDCDVVVKASMPQIRRMTWLPNYQRGSLHNRAVSEEYQAFLPSFPPLA